MSAQTGKLRLKAVEPKWFSAFLQRGKDSYSELSLFNHLKQFTPHVGKNAPGSSIGLSISPLNSPTSSPAATTSATTPTLPVVLRATTQGEFRRFRALSRDPLTTAPDGYILAYLGRGSFTRISLTDSAYQQRDTYLLAMSQVVLNGRPDNFLRLETACRVWGAPLTSQRLEIHLGSHRSPRTRRSPQLRRNDAWFPPVHTIRHATPRNTEVCQLGPIRVTTLEQTLFDVLARFPAPVFLTPADALFRKLLGMQPGHRRVSKNKIDAVRDRFMAFVESRATRFDRKKVAKRLAMLSPLSESPLESLARIECAELGLPEPVLQHEIVHTTPALGATPSLATAPQRRPISAGPVGSGPPSSGPPSSSPPGGGMPGSGPPGSIREKRYYVDLAWPSLGLAIEVDGLVKYASQADIRDEKMREAAICQRFPRLVRVEARVLHKWRDFATMMTTALREVAISV